MASNAGCNVLTVPEYSETNFIWKNGKKAYPNNTSPNEIKQTKTKQNRG